ncbi:MAG: hypothetical protein U9Q07_09290 [Planctomycetota bacterium]|nr:hypothetical protein [Planctomycetota bacterium]
MPLKQLAPAPRPEAWTKRTIPDSDPMPWEGLRVATKINPLDKLVVNCAVNIGRVARDLEQRLGPSKQHAAIIRALHDGDMHQVIGFRYQPGEDLPSAITEVHITHTKYRDHIHSMSQKCELTKKAILCKANFKDIRAWTAYFAVDKDEHVMRAIGDCRAANALFNKPPPTPLLSTDTLIRLLLYFDSPWFAEADLRHWFWQISLSGTDRSFFGISHKGDTYTFQALPMGFSWAPFIAQIISRQIAERNSPFVITEGNGFLHLKNRAGETVAFICIYYDNFLVIAKSEEIRNKVHDVLIKNALYYNAVWKQVPINPADPKSEKVVFRLTHEACTFLGADFQTGNGKVQWRHVQKNMQRWKSRTASPTSTLREVQGICGVIVWNMTMRNWKRREIRDTLKIMSRAASQAYTQRGSITASLSLGEVDTLNNTIKDVLQNEWESATRDPVYSQELIFAVDSSSKARGIVLMNDNQPHEILRSKSWSPNDAQRDIWEKELMTALEALEEFIPETLTNAIVWLLEDNSTATAALPCEVCECDELNDRMAILPALRRRGICIVPVQVASNDEPADVPSRLKDESDPEFAPRCSRAMHIINAQRTMFKEILKDRVSNPTRRLRMDNRNAE